MLYNKEYLYTEGITLIEVLIYVALLSFLLSGFINCAYVIHIQNITLINEINDSYK